MSIIPVVVALLLGQASPAAPQKKADQNEPVTLKGCVVRDSSRGSSYTFTDSAGLKYKLAGKSVEKYSGMSVEVVGLVNRPNLVVKGGLWPTPNVAAQAGNMGPNEQAVAALQAGSAAGMAGTGNVELPTLRITRVGLGSGECKQ